MLGIRPMKESSQPSNFGLPFVLVPLLSFACLHCRNLNLLLFSGQLFHELMLRLLFITSVHISTSASAKTCKVINYIEFYSKFL
jgi:hypothetical protein